MNKRSIICDGLAGFWVNQPIRSTYYEQVKDIELRGTTIPRVAGTLLAIDLYCLSINNLEKSIQ
ncbi:hypothetical protein GCM10007932_03350 [Vibrio penaeicida]|uniref:Uncharacterized protein n=2 Tax=Vibrio TaxID=662 RepID=A0A510IF72_9VIBR|nr:hypothetical protein VroAM7_50160 [Vibrio rotiferianus]GLQ70975.1 hypothetical protein GCM10007932_03350 [Vibrio penaeicida]